MKIALNNLEEKQKIIEQEVKRAEDIIESGASSNEKEKFKEAKTEESATNKAKIPTVPTGGIIQDDQCRQKQKEKEKQIENILERNISGIYNNLPDYLKNEFKKKGEQTAYEINVLLSGAKVKINKIIDLIKNWLKLIPGVNKFFLEQEAKIKADEIMKLKK